LGDVRNRREPVADVVADDTATFGGAGEALVAQEGDHYLLIEASVDVEEVIKSARKQQRAQE
jgi:hypothetical protein